MPYLRKAISVGPFRFNLSKSGVGLSVGVRDCASEWARADTTFMGAEAGFTTEHRLAAQDKKSVNLRPLYQGVESHTVQRWAAHRL
jgi:hypothetical protein